MMTQLSLERIRKIQLDILCAVAAFCEENDICYWIDCGTLLGAIRHKGYIPWDDDIDVGMLREDYDKFAELFNQQNSNYYFACIENTPDFFVPHGKVLDTSTILYEPDESGYKSSVNIDIFVYDNAPNDDAVVEAMFCERDALRRKFGIQNQNVASEKSPIKRSLKYMRRIWYRTVCPTDCIKRMVMNSKRFANDDTRRVGNFTAYARMTCDKRVFRSFVEVEFEGRLFKAPAGYDEWLRSFYGEYMQLPPIEKRVSHHRYVAYIEE